MTSILFTFSQCIRHAFFAGAGYGDLERISDEDQDRWVAYDPDELPFKRVEALDNSARLKEALIEAIAFIENTIVDGSETGARDREFVARVTAAIDTP